MTEDRATDRVTPEEAFNRLVDMVTDYVAEDDIELNLLIERAREAFT